MSTLLLALNLFAILGLAFLLARKQDILDRRLFVWALTIKLMGGIVLGLIYSYYYGAGDTLDLFQMAANKAQTFDPQAYFSFLWNDTLENWKGAARSLFFVKLISLPALITGGNYWVTSLWLSFVAFLGSWYLFQSLQASFPSGRWAAIISLFVFPSVVFWGSGVIKESLGLAAIMVLTAVFVKAMTNRSIKFIEIVLVVVSIWIDWNLKYYWVSVVLPVALTSLLIHQMDRKHNLSFAMLLVLWGGLFGTLCSTVSLIHPNFGLHQLVHVVTENYKAFESNSKPANLIHYRFNGASWTDLVMNSPWAFVSGMFRPFLWEMDSPLKVLVGLENFVVLLLVLTSLPRLASLARSQNRWVTLSAMVYCSVLCVFLALSTPNLGTLARYKVGFLPILLFLVLNQNTWVDKLRSWISK